MKFVEKRWFELTGNFVRSCRIVSLITFAKNEIWKGWYSPKSSNLEGRDLCILQSKWCIAIELIDFNSLQLLLMFRRKTKIFWNQTEGWTEKKNR